MIFSHSFLSFLKTKNTKTRNKMCKTNVKNDLHYANICKYEHEKNMTGLWCKIIPKIDVELIERNEGFYF